MGISMVVNGKTVPLNQPEPDIPEAPEALKNIPVSPEPEVEGGLPTYSRKDVGNTPMEEVTNLSPLYGRAFVNGASPFDVNQNVLGDCYLLNSLAAIAQFRPDILESMIYRAHGRYHESYVVTFPQGHDPVRVSNMFPMRHTRFKMPNGSTVPRVAPLYGHSTKPGELWVSILEKAFAVRFGEEVASRNVEISRARGLRNWSLSDLREAWAHSGYQGYARIAHGYYAGPTLEWLTGGKVTSYWAPLRPFFDEFGLVSLLLKCVQYKWPTVFSTGERSKVKNKALLAPHGYAFLGFNQGRAEPIRLYETNSAKDLYLTLQDVLDDEISIEVCVPKV